MDKTEDKNEVRARIVRNWLNRDFGTEAFKCCLEGKIWQGGLGTY